MLPDAAALARAAAAEVVASLAAAIELRGAAALALAGGSTPRELYRLLAEPAWRTRVAWERVELFWGDERAVPPSHPESNFRQARETLLAHLPLAAGAVHRIEGELPTAEAAARYETVLRRALGEDLRLDLVLLGVGADGHTASLFPGDAAGEGRLAAGRLVVAARAPVPPRERVTLTYAALERAAKILFLVAGESKREAVGRALAPVLGGGASGASLADAAGRDAERPPAGRVRPRQGEILWLLDRAAASHLPSDLLERATDGETVDLVASREGTVDAGATGPPRVAGGPVTPRRVREETA